MGDLSRDLADVYRRNRFILADFGTRFRLPHEGLDLFSIIDVMSTEVGWRLGWDSANIVTHVVVIVGCNALRFVSQVLCDWLWLNDWMVFGRGLWLAAWLLADHRYITGVVTVVSLFFWFGILRSLLLRPLIKFSLVIKKLTPIAITLLSFFVATELSLLAVRVFKLLLTSSFLIDDGSQIRPFIFWIIKSSLLRSLPSIISCSLILDLLSFRHLPPIIFLTFIFLKLWLGLLPSSRFWLVKTHIRHWSLAWRALRALSKNSRLLLIIVLLRDLSLNLNLVVSDLKILYLSLQIRNELGLLLIWVLQLLILKLARLNDLRVVLGLRVVAAN